VRRSDRRVAHDTSAMDFALAEAPSADDPSSPPQVVNPVVVTAQAAAGKVVRKSPLAPAGSDDTDEDEDDSANVSISPQAVNALFPSRQQQRHSHIPSGRPSRESVLQRLSEALLRRCLTKVCSTTPGFSLVSKSNSFRRCVALIAHRSLVLHTD
jgi:hypothetical protein